MQKKGRNITLIILGCVLIALLIAGAYLLINRGGMNDRYVQAVSSGKVSLDQGNYDQAILEYKKAVEQNPDAEEAYIGLATAYERMGNYEEAVNWLGIGFNRTGSARMDALRTSLNILMTQSDDTPEAPMDENVVIGVSGEEELQESPDAAWNRDMLQKFARYSYGDYTREFGEGEITQEDGTLCVTYAEAGFTCYYRNTESNSQIVNEGQGVPYATGMPERISAGNLSNLFINYQGILKRELLEKLIGRAVAFEEGDTMIQFTYDSFEFSFAVNADCNIEGFDAWNEILLPQANQKVIGDFGTISGTVVDALDHPINGAIIKLHNRSDSSVSLEDIVTDQYGQFEADLPVGTYEIEILASGVDEKYLDEKEELLITNGCSYSGLNWIIGIKESGVVRVVLDWGASPRDLDTYLKGTANGQNVFVNFIYKICSLSGFTASLDVDKVDGYGPETLTIEGDLSNCDLVYSVFDFNTTGTMADSGARVRVFWTDGSVQEYTVPADANNYWEVFRIHNGEFELLNRVYDPETTSTSK